MLANIPKGARILEFGAGDGTKDRAKMYDVTAIEHNEAYLTDEYTCIFAPIVENEESLLRDEKGWYDATALEFLRMQKFDLLIIDGPPGEIGRNGILAHPWVLKSSSSILIDDTHRGAEQYLAQAVLERMEPASEPKGSRVLRVPDDAAERGTRRIKELVVLGVGPLSPLCRAV